MRICFYEDAWTEQFGPLTMLRPVFELICGRSCLRERLVGQLRPQSWGGLMRPELVESYAEDFPQAAVNNVAWLQKSRTLLINGRWLPPSGWEPSLLSSECVAVQGGTVVALWIDAWEATRFDRGAWHETIRDLAATRQTVDLEGCGGVLLNHPWDLIAHNADQLRLQFAASCSASPTSLKSLEPEACSECQIAVLGPRDQVRVDATAEIDPFVVIDARRGPVTVARQARIQSFTRLEGPCHIGPETQVFRALIRGGTTIGPLCRVGGEIEESIVHGFANKYHEGFLGHSYVCPWVNLGAMTTNSDLKNDYSEVRVPVNGTSISSGATKVGCFLGDHVKTGLDSMFNTGASIGPFAMVLPAGRLLPKYVPAFARVWHGELAASWPLPRLLEIARTVMARRDRELTPAYMRLVAHVFDQTRRDRALAVEGPSPTLRAA